MPGESFTRRKLPHWYVPGAAHFVTYRLAGTIPKAVIQRWRQQRHEAVSAARREPQRERELVETAHKQFFARYDAYLDTQRSISHLADERAAKMVRENLYHHNGSKYHLISYCIMPNHVHVLLQPIDFSIRDPGNVVSDELHDGDSPLANIMHSLKSYTANRANEILGGEGTFWQAESYDHWVRNDEELERIVLYMNQNPVKAKLVAKPYLWPFGSAHDRYLQDGFENGALLATP